MDPAQEQIVDQPTVSARYLGRATAGAEIFRFAEALIQHQTARLEQRLAVQRAKTAQLLRRSRRRIRERCAKQSRQQIEKALLITQAEYAQNYRQTVAGLEQECLALVTSICRTVLRTEFSQHPEAILARLHSALELILGRAALVVSLAPIHRAAITESLAHDPGLRELSFSYTSSLDPGQIIVATPAGKLELFWEDEVAEIGRKLTAQLRGEKSHAL